MNIEEKFNTFLASGDPIIGISDEQRDWILPFIENLRKDWLRSEIEKVEGNIKTGNNGEGLPFENSPEIYGNARMEAWKNGHNQALTSIITRYKEELKVLESK